jgi:uncharacterized membrane protein YuzA (DUF378 family)
MDNTIYYILGGLAVVYLLISMYNKKNARRRKSRGFMEGYERKNRKKEK